MWCRPKRWQKWVWKRRKEWLRNGRWAIPNPPSYAPNHRLSLTVGCNSITDAKPIGILTPYQQSTQANQPSNRSKV